MVSEDVDGAIAGQLQLDWQASVLLAEIGFQKLLYKDWLRWQKYSARGQFSAGNRQLKIGFSKAQFTFRDSCCVFKFEPSYP